MFLVCNLRTSHFTINGIIDRHHCTSDIPDTNIHLIPFLEVGGLVRGRGVYTPYPYFPHPLYAHYSSKKVYVQIKSNLCRNFYPVMLLSWSAALLKVIFRTCFAYSVLPVSFEILRWIFQECT